ncbi:nuclear transport factor 2 family protein [Glacieibacterium frigidum]|uniref:Ester cyclase n=1 Tax=Glacieibacterium frigidum TaxID=2593303 RepID=A0A552UHQ2_9SPHN|nr:ester cyclase [Glacieibacterium frigidum]TRW17754.1 ester cyclase [Glacieibacterium frigidum]
MTITDTARRLQAPLDAGGRAAPLTAGHVLHAPYPLEGSDWAGLLDTLLTSFPQAEERVDIVVAGSFKGGDWTASTGHVAGLFTAPLCGIPATGLPAFLRFGRFDRWEGGAMAETYLILDLPGLMMQAGVWPLARPLGAHILAPGPRSRDGVVLDGGSDSEARASLDLVEAMIAGLMRYDGANLPSMRMIDFWSPDFWWFGPAPIGTFRGHADYERGHQRPFLTAFPDRIGGDHKCRIGERGYVASTGWPSIRATHSGGGWLGLPATGKRIEMRVMDFWRREGERLVENWVFIDIPDLLRQFGVDVFARMAELAPAPYRA